MDLISLAHSECVKLVRSPERCRTALVSIEGRAPMALLCFILDNGDVLIPNGKDPVAFRVAALRPVTVEFSHLDRYGPGGWTITGAGIAYPMTYRDHLTPVTRLAVWQAKVTTFENGLRIRIARLTGSLTTVESAIPRQRDGRSPGAAPARKSIDCERVAGGGPGGTRLEGCFPAQDG